MSNKNTWLTLAVVGALLFVGFQIREYSRTVAGSSTDELGPPAMVRTIEIPNPLGDDFYRFDQQGNLTSYQSPATSAGVSCGGRARPSSDSRYVWDVELDCGAAGGYHVYVTSDGDVWQDVPNRAGRQRVGRATTW